MHMTNLKDILFEYGYTVNTASKAANISYYTLWNICTGRREIGMKTMIALNGIGIPLKKLLQIRKEKQLGTPR